MNHTDHVHDALMQMHRKEHLFQVSCVHERFGSACGAGGSISTGIFMHYCHVQRFLPPAGESQLLGFSLADGPLTVAVYEC